MSKKLIVVEQGKYIDHEITINKHKALRDAGIDILRLNWFTNDDKRADIKPHDISDKRLRWSEGRNLLISNVIDKYDFVMYTDEDTYIEPIEGTLSDNMSPWSHLLMFLDEWNPIAVNVHTPGISHQRDPRVLNHIKNGTPCLVRKHDACNVILRNDICKLLHPIKYHGSDAVTHYQQYICNRLRTEYYMSPPHIIAINGIEEQHFYTDDRKPAYYANILQKFDNDLKATGSFYPRFISNPSVTTDELLSLSPKKNAPVLTKEEFKSIFK